MKIFYHNDMDGHCSAAIIAHVFSNFNKEDFIEVDYTEALPVEKVKENEKVFFVDYSFTETNLKSLDILLKMGCEIVWIDHHHSSILCENEHPELKNIKGLRIEGISGAALTYIWCFYNLDTSNYTNAKALEKDCKSIFNILPMFIQYVSDYDCWKWEYGEQTEFFKLGIDVFNTNPDTTSIWERLLSSTTQTTILSEIIEYGKVIKIHETKTNTWYRENFAFESEICGYKCAVINKKGNSKMFGNMYDEYPLVVTFVYNGKGYSYSLYSSNPNVDCSEIAKKFGGGGHKGAAGFFINKLIF